MLNNWKVMTIQDGLSSIMSYSSGSEPTISGEFIPMYKKAAVMPAITSAPPKNTSGIKNVRAQANGGIWVRNGGNDGGGGGVVDCC